MQNEDELCLKFFNNPDLDPMTNKKITQKDYDYYKKECKKRGYHIKTSASSYYWKPLNEMRKAFIFDDLLYNVLMAADMDEALNICETNKKAHKICHSKEFLVAKFYQDGWYGEEYTYENFVHFAFLYKVSKLTMNFLKRSFVNKIYIDYEDSGLWLKYEKGLNNFVTKSNRMNYPKEYNADENVLLSLVDIFSRPGIYRVEYNLNQHTQVHKHANNIKALYELLNNITQEDIYTTYVQTTAYGIVNTKNLIKNKIFILLVEKNIYWYK